MPGRMPRRQHPPRAVGARRVLVVGRSGTLAERFLGGDDEVVRLDPFPLVDDDPSGRVALGSAHRSFDAVLLLDVLAVLPDDQGAIDEAARVLRPGGSLVLRVPYRGPLAWLDAMTVARYVGDIIGGRSTLDSTTPVAWRRHYRRRDIAAMLGRRFRVRAVAGTGVGASEAVRVLSMLLCRRLLRWERGDAAANRLAAAVDRVELRLRFGPLGYHLTIVAERLPDEPGTT